ncbi:MAG TPA: LytTR family DNA-binding domain-containing protein [Pyrinomonadaceae bacterium]|nr:LytTR family DNA-binding domain-containing protein [Pyrinomonadaceae bacterium]
MGLRTLIVDDEPLAREGVRMLLENDPEVTAVHECADGQTAVNTIIGTKPDLVFLDVQMPEMDGFEVLEKVGVDRMPNTIFVTAYDKYALQAFEVHALDYLLKPYTNERFFNALERAKTQIKLRGDDNLNHQLSALLDRLKHGGDRLERLAVNAAGRISFVDVEEIDWIEAADTYVRLHVRRESHLVRGTMSGLEAKLDPHKFLRIHRSAIVNLSRIRELQPLFHGEYVVTLQDGTQLTSGRSYRDKLQPLLKNPF